MSNIFRSELRLETLSKKDMQSRIERYCRENKHISCRRLKRRKVYTEKYIEATIPRKDSTKRMRAFFVALDIVKKSHIMKERVFKKQREYEFVGFDCSGTEIRVHLREETQGNNKKLYVISSFPKQNKNPSP